MKLTFIALALFTLLSSCGGHLPVGLKLGEVLDYPESTGPPLPRLR